MSSESQLHLYALPQHLLNLLALRTTISSEPQASNDPALQAVQPTPLVPGRRTCGVCQGATFKDLEGQRDHYRSDWHRYNVKMRLANGRTVSEGDFAQLIEGIYDAVADLC